MKASDPGDNAAAKLEELLASEERYRLLWETSTDAIVLVDAELRIEFANSAMLRVFGYAPAEVIGEALTTLAPESVRASYESEVRRYLDEVEDPERARTIRATGLHKDGAEFPIEIAFGRMRSGGRQQLAGFIRDISERSRADEALRQSEERYHDLIENANDIVYSHDLQGNFTSVNRAAMRVFGYSAEEVMRLNIREIVDPEWIEAAVQAIASKIDGAERSDPYELLTRDRDGRPVWVEVSTRVIREDGRPIGVQGIARDISERKRAEIALSETEARFRTLAAHSLDLMSELGAAGEFVYVGPNARSVLAYEPEALLGRVAFELIHPDDQPEVLDQFQAAIAEPVSGTITFRFLRGDGEWCWLETTANVFDADDGKRHIAVVSRDVTERRRTEEALRESEERLRQFVANAPVVLFATDRQGVFTLYEGQYLEQVGQERGELVGKTVEDVYPSHPQIRENMRRALSGEAFSDIVEIGTVALEVHHTPLRDASGELAGMIGILFDVTARVHAERDIAARNRLSVMSGEVATALAQNDRMDVMLRQCAEAIVRGVEGAFARVWTLDEAEQMLNLRASAGLYTHINGPHSRVPVGQFEIGLIAKEGVRQTTNDVPNDARIGDPAWARAEGIVGFAGYPLIVEGQMLGVLALFARHALPDETIEALASASHAIALGIKQKHAEDALKESEERYRAIFTSNQIARVLVDPATSVIVNVNEGAAAFYGYTIAEMSGKHLSEINVSHTREEIAERTRQAGERATTYSHTRHRLASGEIRDVDIYASPVALDGRTLIFCVVQDVTERERAQSIVAAQRELLEMIALGADLEDVLGQLVTMIESQAPRVKCAVHLLSDDGAMLRQAVVGSLPPAFSEAMDGMLVGPHAGSAGTAVFRGEQVIVRDIETDPAWDGCAQIALEHGLRACWASPVVSINGKILGTFAMYEAEPREPDQSERELMAVATHVSGIAIERRRAERAVRSRTLELESMYKQLVRANSDLEDSKVHLEEKSALLERALDTERERGRRDTLTGALNHAAITEMLRAAIYDGETKTLALAMADVDGLKAANDTYGHQVGDAVLAIVAQKLGRDGAIVGRYGGDEFVAILPGADRAAAERYRQDVLASLAEAGLTDPQTGAYVPVVASIGLAVYPGEAEAVDDLIRLSDSAMYASRRQRPIGESGATLSRPLGGERAAKMVGEIVPLLTSPGALDDKLRLVAHRLSVGAGYDGVNFVLEGTRMMESSAFARVPEQDLQGWNARQRSRVNQAVADMLRRTKRPIIIDDLQDNDLLSKHEGALLGNAGLHSALIAPMIWSDDVIGALSVASKRRGAFTVRDAEFVAAVATQVTAIVRMSSLVEQLQASSGQLRVAHEGTVLMLASAAEAHDHTTGRHLQRVRTISEALGRELGYSDEDAQALGMAAILHDIGKIRVPDSVLGSSKSLADAEWVLMKQHCIWGAAFLSGQPGFELASKVAQHHHERWDGGGYPEGLAGDAIPEAALITTVADSLDAMTNNRPYRAGRPIADAVAEIVSCAGSQFSPRIVDALVRLYERGDLAFVHADDDEEERAA